MTGKDRKALQEAVDFADAKGLMLCFIYNPAFKHYYIQFKAPDTQEEMGASLGDNLFAALTAACLTTNRVLGLLGLEKYEFAETQPLIIAP